MNVTVSVSPGPSSLDGRQHFLVARRNVIVRCLHRCLIEESLDISDVHGAIEQDKIVPHRKLGRSANVLNRDEIFWPGVTSNAVRSNFILSSALTATVFGGPSGAREQLLTENARMLQANPMIGSGTLILFFIW